MNWQHQICLAYPSLWPGTCSCDPCPGHAVEAAEAGAPYSPRGRLSMPADSFGKREIRPCPSDPQQKVMSLQEAWKDWTRSSSLPDLEARCLQVSSKFLLSRSSK